MSNDIFKFVQINMKHLLYFILLSLIANITWCVFYYFLNLVKGLAKMPFTLRMAVNSTEHQPLQVYK